MKFTDELGFINLPLLVEALSQLDVLMPDKQSEYYDHIFSALTDSVLNQQRVKLDSMTSIRNNIFTSILFYNAAQADTKNAMLYEVMFDFWISKCLGAADSLVSKDYWEKYSVDYRIITGISANYNYHSSVGYNDAEKIIINLGDNEYGYIWNKFLVRTSTGQKIILSILLLLVTITSAIGLITITKKLKPSYNA